MEAEEGSHVQIPIDREKENAEVPLLEMVASLEGEMRKLGPLTPNQCIYRVPKPLRVENPAAYTPQVVSIGPTHYRGEGLGSMEGYKRRYLQLFLDRVHRSLEYFAEFVKEREARLRECYADTIQLTSSEFVKMMMFDSAFVYGMLVEASGGIGGSCRIFDRPFMEVNVMVDLMMLENQIPLFILEDLFILDNEARSAQQPTSQITEHASEPSFMDLVCEFVRKMPNVEATSLDIGKVSSSGVVHLLDYLRRCHLPPLKSQNPPPQETKTKCCASMPCFPGCPGSHRNLTPPNESGFLVSKPRSIGIFYNLPEKFGYLILGCLWRCCHPCSQSVPPSEEVESSSLWTTVPTITELHQSGVRFSGSNPSTHLLDIEFDYQQGTLKIPHIFMGDLTETIFRNLLAFEQCHYANNQWLTHYITLLDQLISKPSDVDLLVQSRVLEHALGDNTQVVRISNNITHGLVLSDESYFDDECKALLKYYKVPWHKWKATLRQDYFHNPWAGISVIAAVILLVLTVIQTVYAII